MADSTAASSDDVRHYAGFLLGGLLLAHGAFNLLFNPFSTRQTYPLMMEVGVVLAQPMLFASWLVIGPPPATKRLPLTIAAFSAIILADAITSDDWLSMEYLLIAAILFVITAVVMFAVCRLTGWKVLHMWHSADSGLPLHQFSLRYLLSVTTIFAALLGLGRALASGHEWSATPPILDMLLPVTFVLLALIPIFFAALVVLTGSPPNRILIAIPLLWAGLTWLAVEAIVAVENEPRWEVAREISLMQLGAASAAILSAVLLRIAGYRLYRSRVRMLPSIIPGR
jgi:hypothetical protein